jgi:hypothetical protein
MAIVEPHLKAHYLWQWQWEVTLLLAQQRYKIRLLVMAVVQVSEKDADCVGNNQVVVDKEVVFGEQEVVQEEV